MERNLPRTGVAEPSLNSTKSMIGIIGEQHAKSGEHCDSVPRLPKIVESPEDYVRRVIAEKGLSHAKVAQRARQLGGELSPYVNR
jgi:hypothetical protein